MASVEALLNNLAGSSSRKTKKLSNEEKDRMKSELLKGVPYDNKKLDKLSSTELKILASALGINSFGMKRVDIVKTILSKQKK
jgi:hypothetical protein